MESSHNYSEKLLKRSSFVSMIFQVFGMGLSLVLTPLLLRLLSQEEYGVWILISSIVSWINYFDFGLGSGLRNKIATNFSNKNYKAANEYINVTIMILFKICVIIMLFLLLCTRLIDLKQFFNIHSAENINLILVLSCGFTCLSFIASVANNVLYATQKAEAVSVFAVFGQLLYLVGIIIYSLCGNTTILIVAIIQGATATVKSATEIAYVYKTNKQLKFELKNLDYSKVKNISSFGLQMFVMQITALVLNSTDNLIVAKYVGGSYVTQYSICFTYFNMINIVFVSIITPYLSAYTSAYAHSDFEWISSSLKKSLRYLLIFILGSIVALLIFRPFSNLWLGTNLGYQVGLPLIMMLYFILLMVTHVFSTLLVGIGKLGKLSVIGAIQAIVNIPISIILATNIGLGLNGVILGSFLSVIIGTIYIPVKAAKELNAMKKETI